MFSESRKLLYIDSPSASRHIHMFKIILQEKGSNHNI